jgi:hypothetical protein
MPSSSNKLLASLSSDDFDRSELCRAAGGRSEERTPALGSGLIDYSQKMTAAAMQIAEK